MREGERLFHPTKPRREGSKRNILVGARYLVESCCPVTLLTCTSMKCSKVRNPFGEPEFCTCDFGNTKSMKIAYAEDRWNT